MLPARAYRKGKKRHLPGMSVFTVLSLVMVAAAIFSFVNHRFIGLPTTIGVTLMALATSLALIAANWLGLPIREVAVALVERLNFREVVLDQMLAFLLFAGALNVNLDELLGQKLSVGLLATVGVVTSTVLVGGLTWIFSGFLNLGLGLTEGLLFGALISPTDPIAVLGILRSAGAPKALEAQMAGESLFNDGIGVVVFSLILAVIGTSGGSEEGIHLGPVMLAVTREVIGSLALGLLVGWLTFVVLRSVDNYHVEILITLALAMGLYSLALAMHTSGPLAVVVAGLLIGGKGRRHAMSSRTVERLDMLWELIDEVLNVVLFVMIGFQILVIPFSRQLLLIGLGAIVLVLLARFLSVGATVLALRPIRPFAPHTVKLLTWGGLRGGLSLAMALSLGSTIPGRNTILTATYVVAVFSIAVQGLTFGRLVRAKTRHSPTADAR